MTAIPSIGAQTCPCGSGRPRMTGGVCWACAPKPTPTTQPKPDGAYQAMRRWQIGRTSTCAAPWLDLPGSEPIVPRPLTERIVDFLADRGDKGGTSADLVAATKATIDVVRAALCALREQGRLRSEPIRRPGHNKPRVRWFANPKETSR